MTFGVIGNNTKDSLADAVGALLRLGKKYSAEIILHADLENILAPLLGGAVSHHQFLPSAELVSNSNCIVAFGGDGTILSAARMVGRAEVPILGVNLGKLGFMAEVSLAEMDVIIQNIIRGEHSIEERMLLKGRVENELTEFFALNDVVIDNSSSSRIINISIYVDDDYLVNYSGDGVILATPTGSTAYSLAAGGPIVAPTTGVIIVQPVSPHSLSARTVIVPESSTIRISVEHLSNEARVTADGQLETTYTPPLNIIVSKADHVVKLIRQKNRSYYDVLRAKLFWGSDIRLVKGKEHDR
ncbi:MAG: NAD(+)/NADH kinase [Bacteriovoracaceae bacterium]|nr:NAD(+)/NADH kinase [Bacteroidota bacterium]